MNPWEDQGSKVISARRGEGGGGGGKRERSGGGHTWAMRDATKTERKTSLFSFHQHLEFVCVAYVAKMCSPRNSDSLLVKMKTGMATWEYSLAVPSTLHICLPYDPAIVFLGRPNESKTYVCTETCTQMCTAVSPISDKTQHPACSSPQPVGK